MSLWIHNPLNPLFPIFEARVNNYHCKSLGLLPPNPRRIIKGPLCEPEQVELINDFVAQGYGMLTLGSTEAAPGAVGQVGVFL